MKGINYPLVSETATEFELKWPKIWQESLQHYCHHNKQLNSMASTSLPPKEVFS